MTTLETNNIDPLLKMQSSFGTINDTLTLFKMQISTVQQQLRNLEKEVKKEVKHKKKHSNKKEKEKEKEKEKQTTKPPSGFAKPTKVTKELCIFLEQPEGTEIARTEVTKSLIQYIKDHNLNTKADNISKIVPDDKLKSLLNLDENELSELTFFTIQKHMNKHFFSKKNALTTNNAI